ncbi:Sister chromatid cohesion protein DCC1 [Lamellibrachia satsuma]|nr:Sister chromatid cohesion protein DCC1 [Lamellibrachia satsuma]
MTNACDIAGNIKFGMVFSSGVMESENRTLYDIQCLSGHAKLDPCQLMPGVQCVSFTEQLDNEAVILMEIDAPLLDHLMVGDSLVVRGEKTDQAVLCTKDQTYDIREAETSNTLLMMPQFDFPSQLESHSEPVILHRTVCAMKHEYYELRKIKPRLKHLGELLQENVYSGWECEGEEVHQGKKVGRRGMAGRGRGGASLGEEVESLHSIATQKPTVTRNDIRNQFKNFLYTVAINSSESVNFEPLNKEQWVDSFLRYTEFLEESRQARLSVSASDMKKLAASWRTTFVSSYTFEELSEKIQASEAELLQGLHNLPACLIDGYWRLLDFEFCSKVLESILALKESESWDFDEIPAKACCDLLVDLYPRNVIQHVLDCYGEKNKTEKPELMDVNGENVLYKIKEDNVCRYYAELLLRPVEKFNLQEFENVWQLAVPDSFKTSLYQLQGLALVDRDSTPQIIRYYPDTDLPETASERFNALFRTKEHWTLDEITPYVKEILTEKQKVGTLLNKYARSSTQNGIKVFNSRKPLT